MKHGCFDWRSRSKNVTFVQLKGKQTIRARIMYIFFRNKVIWMCSREFREIIKCNGFQYNADQAPSGEFHYFSFLFFQLHFLVLEIFVLANPFSGQDEVLLAAFVLVNPSSIINR